jgi:hypothetical protein
MPQTLVRCGSLTTEWSLRQRDAVTRFTRPTLEGWEAYMKDSSAGNDLIKKINTNMDDGPINFGLNKIREDS